MQKEKDSLISIENLQYNNDNTILTDQVLIRIKQWTIIIILCRYSTITLHYLFWFFSQF